MRKPHNYMELDMDYISTEYLKGSAALKIAENLGVSKKAILTRLKKLGIERRKQATYDEITYEDLFTLYIENKLSTRSIADKYGCSSRHICTKLKAFGIPVRKHAGDSSFTAEERKEKWGKSRDNHNLWKGGVTELNVTLRYYLSEWKRKELINNNYTCFITGIRGGDLDVHHITPFHEIRDAILSEAGLETKKTIADYTSAEVDMLRKRIIEAHKTEKGYAIKPEIHKLFHRLYGFKTNEADLIEFKNRYNFGEFKDAI
jgi:hypothetical protein